MIRVFGACTVHLVGNVGLIVVNTEDECFMDPKIYGSSSWIEASWDAAVTWVFDMGYDVMGDEPLASRGIMELYGLYRR